MSYVFDSRDAYEYEKWLSDEKNRRMLELENRVMVEMLRPVPIRRLLDIGCGSGASLMPFLNKGIELTGIDPSPYMLDFAFQRLGSRVDLHEGFAEDLPFDDNSFHYSILFLSLEFCSDPWRAIEEACRVTKDRIFVGILNRFSFHAMHCRTIRLFKTSVYQNARFFSVNEIRRLFYSHLGNVPVQWKTVLKLPGPMAAISHRLESARIMQHSPFGCFGAITADPVPRYRAAPLSLKCRVNQATAQGERVASYAGDYRNENIKQR
jgi:SAM-dependent methyltransferase